MPALSLPVPLVLGRIGRGYILHVSVPFHLGQHHFFFANAIGLPMPCRHVDMSSLLPLHECTPPVATGGTAHHDVSPYTRNQARHSGTMQYPMLRCVPCNGIFALGL